MFKPTLSIQKKEKNWLVYITVDLIVTKVSNILNCTDGIEFKHSLNKLF